MFSQDNAILGREAGWSLGTERKLAHSLVNIFDQFHRVSFVAFLELSNTSSNQIIGSKKSGVQHHVCVSFEAREKTKMQLHSTTLMRPLHCTLTRSLNLNENQKDLIGFVSMNL